MAIKNKIHYSKEYADSCRDLASVITQVGDVDERVRRYLRGALAILQERTQLLRLEQKEG